MNIDVKITEAEFVKVIEESDCMVDNKVAVHTLNEKEMAFNEATLKRSRFYKEKN